MDDLVDRFVTEIVDEYVDEFVDEFVDDFVDEFVAEFVDEFVGEFLKEFEQGNIPWGSRVAAPKVIFVSLWAHMPDPLTSFT